VRFKLWWRGADSCRMEAQPKSELQVQREAQFIQDIGAFVRRDFEAIERKMRSDVLMQFPGSSWLAGTYRVEVSKKLGAASSD
jgi:hypothetical protein